MIDLRNKKEVADALRALADAVEAEEVVLSLFAWTSQTLEKGPFYDYLTPGKIEFHARQVLRVNPLQPTDKTQLDFYNRQIEG